MARNEKNNVKKMAVKTHDRLEPVGYEPTNIVGSMRVLRRSTILSATILKLPQRARRDTNPPRWPA
jgi:hypothetical protein